jgi:hypothetical protein
MHVRGVILGFDGVASTADAVIRFVYRQTSREQGTKFT